MQDNSNTANRRGTGFVNLQKVIGANKGNQLGAAVQTGIGNRVGQIKQDLGKVKSQFQTDLGKSSLKAEDEAGAFGSINKAINDPMNISTDEVNKFQGLLSGQFKGPTALSNTAGVDAQAMEVGQFGANVGSAAGRTGLLQRYAGGPKYNAGQQRLDNLLLGQTGSGALKDVRKQALGLSGEVSKEKSSAQAMAGQEASKFKDLAGRLSTRIGREDDPSTPEIEGEGSEIGNIYSDVQTRTKDFNKKQKDLFDLMQGVGSQGDAISAEQLAGLGLTEGQNLYDLKLDQFLNPAQQDQAAQRVAKEEDYKKYQALNRLAGRENTFLSDINQAGKAEEYTPFDKDSFLSQVAAREADAGGVKSNLDQQQAELAYRQQYTNQMKDFLRGTRWGSQVDNMTPQQIADALTAEGSGAFAAKVIEDAGPIQQYMDIVSNLQNQYNTYNPNRRLAISQQAKGPDQQYAMPVNPVLGGGKTVKVT